MQTDQTNQANTDSDRPDSYEHQGAIALGSLESNKDSTRPPVFSEYNLLKTQEQRTGWIQFLPLCLSLFLIGWYDRTVGFILFSLIFILNCMGCVLGTASNIYLTHKHGFGKVITLGASSQTLASIIQATAPPFPIFILSSIVVGFGISLADAQANGYVAGLKDKDKAATKMGIMQAVYGLGALVSLVVSTQFSHLPRWSFHYLVSAGVGLSNLLLLVAVFRFRSQNECLADAGEVEEIPVESPTTKESHYRQIMCLKTVYLLALFIFCYVGAEVTLGSWSVTYIIHVRGGGPASGYVSSGFFGGLTFGRVALLWVNQKISETRVVYIYLTLVLGLQLVTWLAPSLIARALSVALSGVFLGPIYPIMMNHAGRVLPPWLLTGSIGLVAAAGAIGSAAVPFVTGVIASRAGIESMELLIIGMLGLLVCLWVLIPKEKVDLGFSIQPEPHV